MPSKVFIYTILASILFIPGAYGISVSISGEEGSSSFSDTLTIDAGAEDSVNVFSVVKGPNLEQHASGTVDLHKSFMSKNRNGEKAQITADVVNAGHWEYYQPSLAADSTSASVIGFGLTARDAESISCVASAKNRQGDKAAASVQALQGSIHNYWADAYAYADRTEVKQSFDQASGDYIAVKNIASNSIGSVSDAEMKIGGTEINGARVLGYHGHARASSVLGTYAQQEISGGARGGSIDLSEVSLSSEKNISSESIWINGTDDQPGLSSYAGLTESTSEGVSGNNYFSGAKGDSINILASSSNNMKDVADINTYIAAEGVGFIFSGENHASANDHRAYVSSPLIVDGYIGLAEYDIRTIAFASDRLKDSASVTSSEDCLIYDILGGDVYGGTAEADSSLGLVSASQEASGLSGELIELDATAINAAKERSNAYSLIEYPVGINYAQGASVISGVPEVYQKIGY